MSHHAPRFSVTTAQSEAHSRARQKYFALCITNCYICAILTKPMPVRFEPELQELLREGARRTPQKNRN